MDSMIQLLLYAALIILGFLFLKLFSNQHKTPPGPFKFPLIGNLIQIALHDRKKPYAALLTLAKRYGNTMSIQTGVINAVVLSGYEECKKVLNSDDFLERQAPEWLLNRTFGKPIGILFGTIDTWKETRRFTMKHLKDFGFGKHNKMEFMISEEINEYIKALECKISENNGIVRLDDTFTVPVLNVVWGFVSGIRFPHNDPEFNRLIHLVHEYFTTVKVAGSSLSAFPFLAKWLPNFSGYNKQVKINNALHAFFNELINKVRSNDDYKTNPQTFVETFLEKIDSKKPENVENRPDIFTDEILISTIYDFFFAGSETTASAIAFLFLFIALDQNIQNKICKEIDSVIGKTRWPTAEDQSRMPFTAATIQETLRIRTVFPLSTRQAVKESSIKGSDGQAYYIPKGTIVMLNYYAVHMDHSSWKEPEVFRPERFINEDGELFNMEKLIPFALGKRNCVGESLARVTMFLFLTRLLQKFRFDVNKSEHEPSTVPDVGITMKPKPYCLHVKSRQ